MWSRQILKHRFSFHRWIQYKEYRKQLRAENVILNQKISKRKNTMLENIKVYVKANQKRLKLFAAFIGVFSLGFIYDWYLQHKHQVKKVEKRLKQLVLGTERVYSKTIAEVDKRLVHFRSDLEEQIGKFYRMIDRKSPKGIQSVAPQLCSSLGIQPPKAFDISSFFASIRKSQVPLQQIRDNIRLFSMSNQMISPP